MKKLIILTVLGVALIATGCASHNHEDGEGDQASHVHGNHSETLNNHHSSEGHSDVMNKHHGNESMGHHGPRDGGHHAGHHGDSHHGMGHGDSLAGRPGKESEVDRKIKVEANDSMRFIHEPIKVKTGETIRFDITNTGAITHEFSIGTKDEHMSHGKMMMANPDMHHGPGGSSIMIAPGKTETLIWYFEEAWEVQAACNIPGHYQAGMHSPVEF